MHYTGNGETAEKVISEIDRFSMFKWMALIPYDTEYAKRIHTPMMSIFKKYRALISDEQKSYINIFNTIFSHKAAIITEQNIISNTLNQFHSSKKVPKLFSFLTVEELNSIVHMIIDFEPKQTIFIQNIEDKEIYIILKGSFEVIINEIPIKILKKGDIFGEIAFFSDSGLRTASIKSVTKAQVAVIKRKDLSRIFEQQPRLAIKVLLAILSMLSDKLVDTTWVLAKFLALKK